VKKERGGGVLLFARLHYISAETDNTPITNYMKRIILTAFAVIALLAGCEKAERGSDNFLVGTSYRTDGYKAIMGALFGYTYNVFEFSTDSEGTAYWTNASGAQNGTDGEFTYVLDYPNLSVTKKGETTKYVFKDRRTFVFLKDDGTQNTMITYYKM